MRTPIPPITQMKCPVIITIHGTVAITTGHGTAKYVQAKTARKLAIVVPVVAEISVETIAVMLPKAVLLALLTVAVVVAVALKAVQYLLIVQAI